MRAAYAVHNNKGRFGLVEIYWDILKFWIHKCRILGAVHKLCQPIMWGLQTPLPPLSAIVSISPTPPPPFVSHCQHFPNPPNLFIYQARKSLAWSQQGFWQPTFCRKRNLWSLCFDGRINVKFLCIASLEKKKSGDNSIFHPLQLLDTFPFLLESSE